MWIIYEDIYGDDWEDSQVYICKTLEDLEWRKREHDRMVGGLVGGIEYAEQKIVKISSTDDIFADFLLDDIVGYFPEIKDASEQFKKTCENIILGLGQKFPRVDDVINGMTIRKLTKREVAREVHGKEVIPVIVENGDKNLFGLFYRDLMYVYEEDIK